MSVCLASVSIQSDISQEKRVYLDPGSVRLFDISAHFKFSWLRYNHTSLVSSFLYIFFSVALLVPSFLDLPKQDLPLKFTCHFCAYFLYARFFYSFTELPLPSSWFLDQTISFRLGIHKIILLINFISNQTWVLLTIFFLFPYILIPILNFVCIKLISFILLPTMLHSVLLLLNANVEKVESIPPFNIVAASICLADVQVPFSIL